MNKTQQTINKAYDKAQQGLTLIEALVAIAVLLLALVAPITVLVSSSKQTELSSERITAAFLAEDAVEYITAKKHKNRIDRDSDWLDGFEDCMNSICGVDTSFNPITSDASDDFVYSMCTDLSYNTTEHYFGCGSGADWVESKYTREVNMKILKNGLGEFDEMRLTVTVSWLSRETGETESYILQTNLYNTEF